MQRRDFIKKHLVLPLFLLRSWWGYAQTDNQVVTLKIVQ
jgi:hypothetical protein